VLRRIDSRRFLHRVGDVSALRRQSPVNLLDDFPIAEDDQTEPANTTKQCIGMGSQTSIGLINGVLPAPTGRKWIS